MNKLFAAKKFRWNLGRLGKVLFIDKSRFCSRPPHDRPKVLLLFYFLPKIQKQSTSPGLIVSFVGSPLYNVKKFISNIHKKLFIKDDKHVIDSFEIFQYINKIKIPKDYIYTQIYPQT